LRATIPLDIVKVMGIERCDVVAWSTITEKGKKYARLRKME